MTMPQIAELLMARRYLEVSRADLERFQTHLHGVLRSLRDGHSTAMDAEVAIALSHRVAEAVAARNSMTASLPPLPGTGDWVSHPAIVDPIMPPWIPPVLPDLVQPASLIMPPPEPAGAASVPWVAVGLGVAALAGIAWWVSR